MSVGAVHVIDYAKDDFTRSGKQYDLILGANAYHSTADYRRALVEGGTFVAVGGPSHQSLPVMIGSLLFQSAWSMAGSKKMHTFMANINSKDLAFVADLLVSGKVTPVIDRHYPLSDTAEAIRFLGEGHAKGKVVINVD